ncbi:MAG: DUF6788 family protein, partial [Candidatus Ratteibacteria bacterium]
MTEQKIERLNKEKQKVIKELPPLDKLMRGTFIQCYLVCIRASCKCHKAKKYRHGPYYRVSYGKEGRMHHVYVPVKMKKEVMQWTENYGKLWEAIEKISELNIKLLRIKSG